jgi:hypothetical protein
MGKVNAATAWHEQQQKVHTALHRAAHLQAEQLKIPQVIEESRRLLATYETGRRTWSDCGDLALHLAAAYPPDLAMLVLYGLREVDASWDPVPHVLTAMERLYHYRADREASALLDTPQMQILRHDRRERARCAARVLAREVSVTDYRTACGIYADFDSDVRPFLDEALRQFNPTGAAILSSQAGAWRLTRLGLVKWLVRVVFGR